MTGYVTDRLHGYRIIEGIGRWGGFWFVVGRGEREIFNSRVDAVELVMLSVEEF